MAPAEQSYYPLLPLQSPLGNAFSPSLQRLSGDDADLDLFHLTASEGIEPPPGSHSNNFSLLHRQLSMRGPTTCHCPYLWRMIKTPLKMALLPLVAIGYLAFCYAVHGKVVPVNTLGLYGVTQQHFAAIKGGITSISIIIISIALYPIYDVVSSLKSEEFFRALESHDQGVQLETINHISTPSFGNIGMLVAIWDHTCSNYYILGIVASLLVWVVATLAPGALTINNALADGELMAFAIGAVPAQSVLNGTFISTPEYNSSANAITAASVAWAEMKLGVQYSFGIASTSEPDYAAFIAPVPLDVSTTTSARWLTDVIGINPTCSWASTNLTTPITLPFNSTAPFNAKGEPQPAAIAYLLDFNLDVKIFSSFILRNGGSTAFATVLDPTYAVTNHTTHVYPSDGSTVFLLGQCQPDCLNSLNNIILDMTGINTTFTISFTDQTWNLAILVCRPNITIETREMRNNGHGILTVQPPPAGGRLKRQGNLNPIQTNAMFSIATMSLTESAGPLSGPRSLYSPLGSQVQGDVLFGQGQFEKLQTSDELINPSVTVTLASIEDITKGYTQIIRSAAKAYLGDYLGTAYVPGRISTSEIIFAASIPNLAISSAVFVLLFALIIIAHFRQNKGMEFTLVNVAAAVHGSELPAQVAESTGSSVVYEHMDTSGGQPDVIEMWGKRRVFMQKRADGSPVLHLSP